MELNHKIIKEIFKANIKAIDSDEIFIAEVYQKAYGISPQSSFADIIRRILIQEIPFFKDILKIKKDYINLNQTKQTKRPVLAYKSKKKG